MHELLDACSERDSGKALKILYTMDRKQLATLCDTISEMRRLAVFVIGRKVHP